MLLAHGLAVQAFRAHGLKHGQQIGIPLNLSPTYPVSESQDDKAEAWLQDGFENPLYLDPILRGSYPEDMLSALRSYSAKLSRLVADGQLRVG